MTEAVSKTTRRSVAREELARVLTERAAWTYARLSTGRRHNVDLYEGTITQDLLLDISTVLPDMAVKTFTRREEARSGADWYWEWWFHGQEWFGLLAQAKRLKKQGRGKPRYDLGYKVGSERNWQVD